MWELHLWHTVVKPCMAANIWHAKSLKQTLSDCTNMFFHSTMVDSMILVRGFTLTMFFPCTVHIKRAKFMELTCFSVVRLQQNKMLGFHLQDGTVNSFCVFGGFPQKLIYFLGYMLTDIKENINTKQKNDVQMANVFFFYPSSGLLLVETFYISSGHFHQIDWVVQRSSFHHLRYLDQLLTSIYLVHSGNFPEVWTSFQFPFFCESTVISLSPRNDLISLAVFGIGNFLMASIISGLVLLRLMLRRGRCIF